MYMCVCVLAADAHTKKKKTYLCGQIKDEKEENMYAWVINCKQNTALFHFNQEHSMMIIVVISTPNHFFLQCYFFFSHSLPYQKIPRIDCNILKLNQ